MSHAAREKAKLEEARQRAEEIRATDEAQAAAVESSPLPHAEIAWVHGSGRQHDHAGTNTAGYQRPQLGHRRSPHR